MSDDFKPLYFAGYEFLERILRTGSFNVAYDLGANDGGYSMMLAPRCKVVHAFEPVPWVADVLDPRARVQGNIVVHRQAMGETAGVVKDVRIHQSWTLVPENKSLKVCPDHASKPAFDMEVTTIDIQADRIGAPDIMKIDVDGYELRALKGGLRTLRRHPCPIMFEYSSYLTFFGDGVKELLALLYDDLGYQMWSMDGKFCATTAVVAMEFYPAHSSYDVMLLHRADKLRFA